MKGPVAFLFLGETLLIPHLWPIVEALAARRDTAIDLWVATTVHEDMLTRWAAALDHPPIRIRRAPGFRTTRGLAPGDNPPLPAKLPMLARLAPRLWRTPVAVCAEQTSLWLPRLLPMLPTRFIDTFHGAGSMMAKGHGRRRAGWRTLVAADRDRQALIALGDDPARVVATGYVKASFTQRSAAPRLFADDRPIILYTPHWQKHRSSWWRWGPSVIKRIVASGRYNLIFAPHQRLVENAPELRAYAAELGRQAGVHCDLDSFATVDGSYTAAADIYLGDTSSQVLEFLMRVRPCVFLNASGVAWTHDPSYAMWSCGEVVDTLDMLLPAIELACARHSERASRQVDYVLHSLGDTGGGAPGRAVAEIMLALTA